MTDTIADGTSDDEREGVDATPVGDPTDETVGSLRVLEDVDHPAVPDGPTEQYHQRELADGRTDVEIVTRALALGMNVLLKGPPGVGKSYLTRFLCASTNRPLYRITLSETTYREDLLGYLHLASTPGGDSVTRWVDGPLTRAAREGGVLLLDEINAIDANTSAALNAVLERQHTRSLTIPQTGETIDPHEQFRVVGTANPGYQGTYELNSAFEDRFRHVELDYLPPKVETRLVGRRAGLSTDRVEDVKRLVALANRFRKAYRQGQFSTPITTRELVRIAQFTADDFMSLEEAVRSELLARVDETDESVVETTIDKAL